MNFSDLDKLVKWTLKYYPTLCILTHEVLKVSFTFGYNVGVVYVLGTNKKTRQFRFIYEVGARLWLIGWSCRSTAWQTYETASVPYPSLNSASLNSVKVARRSLSKYSVRRQMCNLVFDIKR